MQNKLRTLYCRMFLEAKNNVPGTFWEANNGSCVKHDLIMWFKGLNKIK